MSFTETEKSKVNSRTAACFSSLHSLSGMQVMLAENQKLSGREGRGGSCGCLALGVGVELFNPFTASAMHISRWKGALFSEDLFVWFMVCQT